MTTVCLLFGRPRLKLANSKTACVRCIPFDSQVHPPPASEGEVTAHPNWMMEGGVRYQRRASTPLLLNVPPQSGSAGQLPASGRARCNG